MDEARRGARVAARFKVAIEGIEDNVRSHGLLENHSVPPTVRSNSLKAALQTMGMALLSGAPLYGGDGGVFDGGEEFLGQEDVAVERLEDVLPGTDGVRAADENRRA